MLLHNLEHSPAAFSSSVSCNKRLRLLMVIVSNENKNSAGKAVGDSSLCECENVRFFEHVRTGKAEKLSKLRKLEEGGESFSSCIGLYNSPLTEPMNEIVLCCLLCLAFRETVQVRIGSTISRPGGGRSEAWMTKLTAAN